MKCPTCNGEIAPGLTSCPTCALRRSPSGVREAPPRSASTASKDLAKASELFTLAMAERDKGNLAAARTNLKLAVTFDPTNAKYRDAYVRLESSGPAAPSGSSMPPSDPTANFHPTTKRAYAEACAAEDSGDLDRAIKCYEIALRAGEHAIILSKLGLLLATHKGDFTRGKDLVTRAVVLQPDNAELKANKTKLLDAVKTARTEKRSIPPASTSGFWKMFKRD